MPELPEVETVCRELKKACKGQEVVRVQSSKKKLRNGVPSRRLQQLVGEKILDVRRRAKYIIFDLESYSVLNHLGMSGWWRVQKNLIEKSSHDHVIISLKKPLALIYNDPRRFGLVEVFAKGEEQQSKWLQHLGPEPLENFSGAYLKQHCRGRKTSIKSLIMNQEVVVGVGNIYACEALFRAGIRPQRRASTITQKECDLLVQSIQDILKKAILCGGSTIRDFKQTSGDQGHFQGDLHVYVRREQKCKKCHTPIRTTIITGRSTFHCPRCQH